LPMSIPSRSGALCLINASRNTVEAVATWGEDPVTESTFAPVHCWALRRGKIHLVENSFSPLRCQHLAGKLLNGYVCVPLVAQGETLGVLYAECEASTAGTTESGLDDPVNVLVRQAGEVGERLSLALANLHLREMLRSQSIRDPLTGLFNRRYMEETLERELRRAARSNQPVSLLMLDVDHFKRFNDTFGHQAGDTILRALGDFMNQRIRAHDIACRYGGEEFALLMPGAPLSIAQDRGDALRERFKNLSVQHAGQVLGTVSISIGIAAFPDYPSASELIRAADQALYRAKAEGRDRVIVDHSQTAVA